ncbi:MAG TPA: hypothetical protein VEV37_08975 [Bryobacteraceae bacterium]|nr:hypothetical protein [Bryobacteraceae bacterium]
MTTTAPEALILDLLAWLSTRERTYEETMQAWRTSCPRFPVWEDALDHGLVTTDGHIVQLTSQGLALLATRLIR